MFYIVYKTTNQVNGKFYIGTHKTIDLNDDYLGSGKYLKYAIEKYGAESFKKEILFVFDNPEEMFAKEAEIVTEEFLSEHNTYNLKKGGFGGFDHINKFGLNNNFGENCYGKIHAEKLKSDDEYRKNHILSWTTVVKECHKQGKIKYDNMTGKRHKEETKKSIGEKNSIQQAGSKNSQYGTMWITNGVQNKKIKVQGEIPSNWRKGRVLGL